MGPDAILYTSLMPYKDPADKAKWKRDNRDKVAQSCARYWLRKKGNAVPHPCEWAHETSEQRAERARIRYQKSNRKRQAKGLFVAWWKSKGKDYRSERSKTRRIRRVKHLFIEQLGLCNGCKERLGDKWDIDHIIPLSKGGKTVEGNLQILCVQCNRKKGTLSMGEFMEKLAPRPSCSADYCAVRIPP